MKKIKALFLFVCSASLLVAAPLYAKSDAAKRPDECRLYFDHQCLAHDLEQLLDQQTTFSLDVVTAASLLMIELSLKKRFQTNAWPYHYNGLITQPIRELLLHPKLNDIRLQVQQMADGLDTHPKINDLESCIQTLLPKHASQTQRYITGLLCTSAQMPFTAEPLLEQKRLESFENPWRLTLLQVTHGGQIAQGNLSLAEKLAEGIVVETALMPIELQREYRVALIESQLSVGHDRLAKNELSRFTPAVDKVIVSLQKLDVYKVFADFLTMNHNFEFDQSQQMQPDAGRLDKILQSMEHLKLMEQLADQDLEMQLRLHRLIIQAFFYSFLQLSPQQDLVIAFHTQMWHDKWRTAPAQVKLQEGLQMMFLALRMGSLFDQRRMIMLERRR